MTSIRFFLRQTDAGILWLLPVALSSLVVSIGYSATITVRPDGTGDAPTIQAAVEAAENGDVISLTDGTFTGAGNRDVSLLGKAVRIESESGDPSFCTIDGEGSEAEPHRVFLFAQGETNQTEIKELSIRGGFPPIDEDGGAVAIRAASPVFTNCVFEANSSGDFFAGGGVACESGAAPRFAGCTFLANVGRQGGAFSVVASSVEFDDCIFDGNEAAIDGGSIFGLTADLTIRNCTFSNGAARFGGAVFLDNDSEAEVSSSTFLDNNSSLIGGAFAISASDPTFTECTFVGNGATSFDGMGGGAIWCSFDSSPRLERCLLAFQTAGAGLIAEKGSSPDLICCDLFGNKGGDWTGLIEIQAKVNGNLSADPFLCDLEAGDLKVAANSPCLPDENDCVALIGRFGKGCEAIPVLESSWGEIKSRFLDR